MSIDLSIPASFEGVGYSRPGQGLPLEAIRLPVPRPGPDQVLVKTKFSSLNPLDYKLADLNFLGRTPPVILGFDLAGIVVATGAQVTEFAVGDAVAAMVDTTVDGAWAVGGQGGYALAREALTVRKPDGLSFAEAAALPLCFLSAYLGLHDTVRPGDVVYIPGGGGGVGHLALQIANRVLGATTVISSGSSPDSRRLAGASGADHVFDYKRDDIAAEIARLTGGRGVDVVYDITYSEQSFVETARTVRDGGKWVVLGVGPGKTSRTAETQSPVAGILAERRAQMVNVNMIRYFTEPARLDRATRDVLQAALQSAMRWAVEGRVVPHIDRVLEGNLDAINAGLAAMKSGSSQLGKTIVQLDRDRETP